MRMGFGEKCQCWIKSCITIMSFVVIVNVGLTSFFQTSSGLKQGDSLSPLLFVVVMEGVGDHVEGVTLNFCL